MGWFEDLGKTVTDPIGWASGQLGGSQAKDKWDKLKPIAVGTGAGILNNMTSNMENPSAAGDLGIPDYTNQWEKISQDLNSSKLQEGNNALQAASGGALANATNNLAMKGGLSAGANERLAADNMSGFQDAYSGLATKFGLGSAEIAKQGLETKQDMALRLAESKDRTAAARAANKPGLVGGLLGSLGLDGIF